MWFDYVLQCLPFVLAFIAFIITFVRTGSVKKSLRDFKEVFEVKYRTFDTRDKTAPKPTEFSPYVDDYVLNPDTNELEKLPNPKNIQAKIDSYIECALDRSLEKFMPNVVSEIDDVSEQYSRSREDLASVGEAMEIAEEYRDKFGLSDNASIADIYSELDKHSRVLKDKLSKFNVAVQEDKVNGKVEKEASVEKS